MRIAILVLWALLWTSCGNESSLPNEDTNLPAMSTEKNSIPAVQAMTLTQANHLASLPLKCLQKEFPNKLGQTLADENDLATPQELHPAFYGCFDWHSAVHGHWMLIALLKKYPNLEQAATIRQKLKENLSEKNILEEVVYFKKKQNKSYERTYGWAWLLKLAEELYTWDDPMAKELYKNLSPLTNLIRNRYLDFLPKLLYPIRVGEHTNTGFGVGFAWDYAQTVGDEELLNLINQRARDWYGKDVACPLTWEPSGFDFLSPCLEEADIMRRVLPPAEFNKWLRAFLPQLYQADFKLSPAQVSDRSDGKLVHLDGVNFSRAWVLYGLANQGAGDAQRLQQVANEHMAFSLGNIVDGDYAGEHWLASFAVYALLQAEHE